VRNIEHSTSNFEWGYWARERNPEAGVENPALIPHTGPHRFNVRASAHMFSGMPLVEFVTTGSGNFEHPPRRSFSAQTASDPARMGLDISGQY